MTIQMEQAAILRKLAEQFDGRRLCNWVPGVDWPMSIKADEATLAALDAGAAALSRQREQDDHGAAAVQAIEQFAAGWDESGLVGIREPYRWETVARACLDVLRSIAVRHIAIHGVQPLAVQQPAALSPPSRQLENDDGAGLIHPTIPDMAGTEPSLNIPMTAEELDWVEHAASIRNLLPPEYVRRAINLALRSEGVDAVLLSESDDEESGPTCESCSEPATRTTADDVDMCEVCYQSLCDEQGVTGEEVGSGNQSTEAERADSTRRSEAQKTISHDSTSLTEET